jgi:hypothetical protein
VSGDLLRVYQPYECGADGYPFAWHRETAVNPEGVRLPPNLLAPEDAELPRSPAIKDYIRELARHRCLRCGHPFAVGETPGEWSPCDEECRHAGPVRVWFQTPGIGWQHFPDAGGFDPRRTRVEANWRVLTVHHLNEDKPDCRWWNLAALCQRCHLRMQRAVVMGRPYHYEHSEWFRPFAAGFYAWKYEGRDVSRAEAEERMPELLAHEHRWTQETLDDDRSDPLESGAPR